MRESTWGIHGHDRRNKRNLENIVAEEEGWLSDGLTVRVSEILRSLDVTDILGSVELVPHPSSALTSSYPMARNTVTYRLKSIKISKPKSTLCTSCGKHQYRPTFNQHVKACFARKMAARAINCAGHKRAEVCELFKTAIFNSTHGQQKRSTGALVSNQSSLLMTNRLSLSSELMPPPGEIFISYPKHLNIQTDALLDKPTVDICHEAQLDEGSECQHVDIDLACNSLRSSSPMDVSEDQDEHPSDTGLSIHYMFHPQAQISDAVEHLDGPVLASSPQHETPKSREETLEERLLRVTGQPPWAPFRSRPDFEFQELMENSSIKGRERRKWLQGVAGIQLVKQNIADKEYVYPYRWYELRSHITFISEAEIDNTMDLACKYTLGVSLRS
jgi:hypothetical protein